MDRYHHKLDIPDAEPSNPCPFCGEGDLVLTDVSPSMDCAKCLGAGWYNQASGGGADLKLDRMVCNDCTTVSLTCNKCDHVLDGAVIRKNPPLPRITHKEAMALIPSEWIVLSAEDDNQNSRIRFAEFGKSGGVGLGGAEFWREPDISEFGEKCPYPTRSDEWKVDPEHGFGLSKLEIERLLAMWPDAS